MKRIGATIVAIAAAGSFLVRCLPGDTRPTPGGIFITVAPSDAVKEGVTTMDGWSISFEKLLVSLGNAGLRNDSCTDYNEGAGYDRLINLAAPIDGPQKLAQVFGLGTCSLQFRLTAPGTDAVLGEGVTAADLAMMRLPGMDAVVPTGGRPVIYAQGHASRSGVTKHFAWTFLQPGRGRGGGGGPPPPPTGTDGGTATSLNGRLDDCGAPADAGPSNTNTVNLQANDSRLFAITVYGEQLFRSTLEIDAPLRFEPFADADTNGDQTITQEELDAAPGPPPAPDAGPPPGDGGLPPLSFFVYESLATGMIYLSGKPCPVDNGRPGGGG